MTKINASRREFLRAASVLGGTVGSAAAPLALNLSMMGNAAAQSTGYRAIVCLFLYGGNDSANMVLPTDATSWSAYTSTRSTAPDPIALRPVGTARDLGANSALLDYLGGVLPVTPDFTQFASPNNTRTYAVHPAMPEVQSLFSQGRLGIVANAGPLVEPLANKAAYRSSATRKPAKLFSHNDQQSTWQALAPEGARVGWGGRLGDLVASGNGQAIFTNISAAGNAVFMAGNTVFQYQVGSGGATAIRGLPGVDANLFGSAAAGTALQNIVTADNQHLFAKEYAAITRRSVDARVQFQAAYTPTDTVVPAITQYTSPLTRLPANNALATQLRTVARIIAASTALGATRQVFFVSMGGFDTHDNQNRSHADLMARLSHAIGEFDRILGTARGQVTLFTASDFGRTFTSNGDGTDHGWGSHHFVYGGAVRGREIYGRFPTVGLNHDDEVGSGSFLPGVAVDQIGGTLGRWFGVSDSNLDTVFPNLNRFQRDLGFIV
ncbi:DUF1501 domain-containing protein [uncultured Methylibium sp.]|uniref:DUF1501 domain-containing protein n=1 Tax=uncultured Methylibium sp. TaxID=381093 RepID=UPI0025F795CF|nr:DUF1501 domain-containing protein [uncultured Methylibium sp.]